MKKEKKALVKNFKAVIEDLMDNYEIYTDEEKEQIKEIFQKAVDLNTILDKYDVAKGAFWVDFCDSFSRYFGVIPY
jgi:hypothetical protein